MATAATVLGQQVQIEDKNVVDHKTMVDFKGAPPPIPVAFLYLAPQMIGDHGFGGVLDPVKIAENESPRPTNRIFATYNYFNEIQQGRRRTDDLHVDLHREVIGFEKTFFNSNFSVGMRLPFSTRVETFRDESDSETNFGNLNLIAKYALWNNPTTGSVFSAGLSVTLPTETGDTRFTDAKFQPYIGGVYNWNRFYVQGFSSVVVPTDCRDSHLWFNDIGAGYYLYQSSASFVRAVVPTVEFHMNTPFAERRSDFCPQVNLTPGLHLQVLDRTWISVAGVAPLTGRRPFDLETIAQLNVRF